MQNRTAEIRQRYGIREKLVPNREERVRARLVKRLFAVIDFTDFPPEKCNILRFESGRTFMDFSCTGPNHITEPQIENLFKTLREYGFPAERRTINSHVMGTFSHSYLAWTIRLNETQLNEAITSREEEVENSCTIL